MSDYFRLLANHCVDAARLTLAYRTLPAEQTVSGTPRVGTAELAQLGDCAIGVWEMSPSVSTDVEIDEFFIVLSGEATVTFADGSAPLHLKAGSLGRLAPGTATTWTVTETLRKVYIA
ncbi:cupin domain-containing protein [Ideonella sp.]|uniref:cupin domain-containing protein n=1 Tax=Ideonella sp. TaxID=1929293 RepID=UPI0035AEA4D0